MRKIILAGLCLFIYTGTVWAQDAETIQPAQETITVPRAEFEELKATVLKIQQELQELKDKQAQPPAMGTAVVTGGATSPAADSGTSTLFGGRYLALPDISFIAQAIGKVSSDRDDDSRDTIRLSEAELAIQGYVYPTVRADTFITMSPEEDEPAQIEEAFITGMGLLKGLNLYLGKKHVTFGRTNSLHRHSWLYPRQPLVLGNMVAEESLAGEGAEASYVIPTGSDLFAQINLGAWTGEGPGESSDLPDVVKGPGASFSDRFGTARLWTAYPVTENSELELGGSYAYGDADGLTIFEETEEGEIEPVNGHAQLIGADITYRYFGEGARRLLLRAESIWRREYARQGSSTAKGYYLFGNYRWNQYNSVGILHDWSEFPQSPDLHESALSLILTRNFTEQFYVRLQGTHGSRPNDRSYDEAMLQFVWGIGPHTHNLE